MQALEQQYYTPEEYLKLETAAEYRSEYLDSQIVPLAGGSANHNQIAGNFYARLNASSAISEFHTALGQFLNYRAALKFKEPERKIFLAIPLEVYQDFFSEEIPQLSIREYQVSLLVFDPKDEEIVQWIP